MAEFCWVRSLKKGIDVQHLEAKNMRGHGDVGRMGVRLGGGTSQLGTEGYRGRICFGVLNGHFQYLLVPNLRPTSRQNASQG